ncbi:hypothetical protein [Mesorhizobium sp. M0011]|uniref:hypothetical protein n=1 Tax=Mesorhizobium sp. M0011 TaxID=2956839 RepID=UPI00333759ED
MKRHDRHGGTGLSGIHVCDQQRSLKSGLAMSFAAVALSNCSVKVVAHRQVIRASSGGALRLRPGFISEIFLTLNQT